MITKAHSETEKFIYNNYIILITGLMALEVSPMMGLPSTAIGSTGSSTNLS